MHFRRGFDDSGFAKTILLVEPTEPFLGTVRLDALNYDNVALNRFYPFGQPGFPHRPFTRVNPSSLQSSLPTPWCTKNSPSGS